MIPSRADLDAPGATILVVDDELLVARRVAEMLRELGHEPRIATSWSEALAAFDEQVDLVLLDLIMPAVDGLKLAGLLRQRQTTYTPIVFLTGRGDDATKERALDAGGDDFLVKPVTLLELRVRTTAMLRIRRLTLALHAQATVDALTGVGTRRAFESALERRNTETRRYRRPFSVLLLDIDHFKLVNDNHGHDVGDDVLRSLGATLCSCVRGADQAFRYGGEEFAIILPETPSEGATALAERIRKVFRAVTTDTVAGAQTLSVGIATATDEDDAARALDTTALLKQADTALYEAKDAGRDRVVTARRA